MSSASPRATAVLPLSRGGTIVRTSIGAVQFGAPPETIKDALSAGVEVPSIFVMPSVWFSTRRGMTLAELEFPVYYNYFILGRRVVAVTDEAGRDRLRAVLRESLFGPATYDANVDYEPSVPAGARADFPREGSWFRRKPGAPQSRIELDDVLDFALYDAEGRARLGGGVEVVRAEGGWQLYDGGQLLVELEDEELPLDTRPVTVPAGRTFAPLPFGLTVLGSSHGFDPSGKTTGFVLWLNRRGILVDPPCDATHTLRSHGVSPAAVDSVILTHCHADHDAGVFQKLLESARVDLYTTPTILGSFLRKYVALTGEPEERLRRLFVFRPITIGAPLHIHGGEFRFFYTLHSIPTIGFECYFGGKSFVYSADTLWDPTRIAALAEEGILGRERAQTLHDFPWHHSLILHEAGVPPIHTPAANLAALPAEVKARLRIIHIAEADLPVGCGLRLARTGFDSTIELPVADPPYAEALQALDALAAIDLFRDFTVEKCREFLTIARREPHRAGALVIGEGEVGDKFYIIVAGEAAVVKDGVVIRAYRDGDFFGETAMLTGAPRSADVRAKTDLVLLAIDKYDFLSFLRGTNLPQALSRLAKNRDLPSWDLMSENAVLSMLRARERTRLQAALDHCRLEQGDHLWDDGQLAPAAWLLDDAEVELVEPGQKTIPLGRAAWVGDIDAVTKGKRMRTRAVVARSGGAFRIAAARLAAYLEETPALMLALSGAAFVV